MLNIGCNEVYKNKGVGFMATVKLIGNSPLYRPLRILLEAEGYTMTAETADLTLTMDAVPDDWPTTDRLLVFVIDVFEGGRQLKREGNIFYVSIFSPSNKMLDLIKQIIKLPLT